MKKLKLEPRFCVICDKELNRRQVKSNRNTCSKECGYIYLGLKLSGENSQHYKGGKITLQCKYCGGDFKVYLSKKDYRNCCSRICNGLIKMGKNNSNYREIEPRFCAICNKLLTKNQIKYNNRTCSRECGYKFGFKKRKDFLDSHPNLFAKENNPNWQGGIGNEPYPIEFNGDCSTD